MKYTATIERAGGGFRAFAMRPTGAKDPAGSDLREYVEAAGATAAEAEANLRATLIERDSPTGPITSQIDTGA